LPILRKALFYLFLLIYLIACPVTILYALGYIWKPGGEEALVKTGLIYLSTMPSGASVSLGKNVATEDKTPTVLRDLVPGNYSVTLSIKDYRPWFQMLPVEAEKATVLDRILLVPEKLPSEELSSVPFDSLICAKGTRFAIASGGPALKDYIIYDFHAKKFKSMVSSASYLGSLRPGSFTTEDGSACILVLARAGINEKYLWIRLEGALPEAQDVSDLFPKRPETVAWENKEKDAFFSFDTHSLNRLNVASKAIYPKIVQGIHGFGFFNKKIYLLDADNRLRVTDNEGKGQQFIPYNSLFASPSLKERYFYRLSVLSEDDVLLLGERGDLWTNRSPKALVESGVDGIEVYATMKKALVFRRDKIGVVEFPPRSVLEKTPEENPKVVWVYDKKDGDIRQAFWLYEGSHILFRDGDKTGLLELGTYGAPYLYDLFRVKSGTGIAYFEAEGKIYYLDASSSRLSSAEILPRAILPHLAFQETKDTKKEQGDTR